MDELLTTTQAAEYLGLSGARIRQLAGAGRIGRKHGFMWLFSREELDEFAKQERPSGRPAERGGDT